MEKTGRKPTSYWNNFKARQRYKQVKQRLIDLNGGKCMDCGNEYPSQVYDFHHRDPSQKEFALYLTKLSKPWDVVKAEADKCDMLCANCHRIRHIQLDKENHESRQAE